MGCQESIQSGSRCPNCRPKRTRRPKPNPFYSSYRWRKLARDTRRRSPLCERCGHTGSPDNCLTTEHVLSLKARPDLRLEPLNTATLCNRCNASRQPWPQWRQQMVLDAIEARKQRAAKSYDLRKQVHPET
ncbi:HNH endonuclease [Mycobacterium sp. SMC-2]|nr:HNH endonuclease [Mycobacterium sp. SMC-2]